jgi:hypothetical protein
MEEQGGASSEEEKINVEEGEHSGADEILDTTFWRQRLSNRAAGNEGAEG